VSVLAVWAGISAAGSVAIHLFVGRWWPDWRVRAEVVFLACAGFGVGRSDVGFVAAVVAIVVGAIVVDAVAAVVARYRRGASAQSLP
jgi:hypothetical protein